MATLKRFFLWGTTLLVLLESSRAERFSNWRAYKTSDGFPEAACASVRIAGNGNVIVRHLTSPIFSELDGYSVRTFHSSETLDRAIQESPGGQLWTVSRDGLSEWKDGTWLHHPIKEIAESSRADSPSPNLPAIFPVRQGHVLFLLPDRLMELNSEDPERPETRLLRRADETRMERFTGMCPARDGGLWISGVHGLAKLSGPARSITAETVWQEHAVPDSERIRNLREPIEDKTGRITSIADLSGNSGCVVAELDGEHWATWTNKWNIQRAWRGPDQTLWAITADALLQWDEERAEFIENEELSAHRYYDAATAPDGTFWVATSDGLFHNVLPLWRTPRSLRALSAASHGFAESPAGRLWFISGTELHSLEDDRVRSWALPSPLTQNPQTIRTLFPLTNGDLLVAGSTGFVQFEPSTGHFKNVASSASDRLNCVGLWKSGLVCFQKFTSADARESAGWQLYDGVQFQSFPQPPPKPPFENEVAFLFTARNGDLWLASDQGTAWLHDGKWRNFSSTDHTTPESPIGFVELVDGKIWCATPERIWAFDGRNWLVVKTGFDRINAVVQTRDGSVWVATNNGVHRFFHGAWIENDTEEGLPALTIRELYEDQRGHLWAGTGRGLSQYDPEADLDSPRTYVPETGAKPVNFPEGSTITLSFSGRDKWKASPQNRLLFFYRLDEHDWMTAPDASAIPFTDLPAGKHHFQIHAMDRNGNLTLQPGDFVFAVVAPWYKETRLVLISLTGLAIAVFFAALAFNRHLQLLRSYSEVERKVAERTRQLEIANNELLHSQKMNALGTLAAGIAHDFNNILSIIKGSAQIIEDNLDQPQKVQTRLDRIKTVIEQGAGIVNAMLGFSRNSEQQSEPCNINEVVRDTIKLLGDRFLREVEIQFEAGPELPEIRAPRDFIQQILLNFIFNAAEAMSGRKRIVLATRRQEQLPDKLVLMPARATAYVFVEVRDSGSGITGENLPRIFEPFFTTKSLSTRRGTGLGLSMVYELARKMEAGLAVHSVVNQGSTFTLILTVQPGLTADGTPIPHSLSK